MDKLGPLSAEVRLYGPGTPRAEDMPNRSVAPRLTQRMGRLLVGLKRYVTASFEAGVSVEMSTSLLEAHKITYLLQAAGVDLGYRFERGHYGPYSSALDRAISRMEGHYLLGFGDGTGGARADLRLLPAVADAESLLAHDEEFARAWALVARAIEGYEYPDGLELLTTVHYLVRETDLIEDAVHLAEQVAGWNARKRELFPAEDVVTAWERLRNVRLLAAVA